MKPSIEQLFKEHQGNIVHKWEHYMSIYDRHFSKFRDKSPTILEIGVYKGGSLEIWRKYFGSNAKIFGIDINPLCKQFESTNTKIFIGSQDDVSFLEKIKKEIGPIDILIDDGGHTMKQLKISFKYLYEAVSSDGIYLAEDLHTCYWHSYGGGYRRKSTFIEYAKRLIDDLHEWYFYSGVINEFAKSTYSIHFYDSICVFEKSVKDYPKVSYYGVIDSENISSEIPVISLWSPNYFLGIYYRLKYKLLKILKN